VSQLEKVRKVDNVRADTGAFRVAGTPGGATVQNAAHVVARRSASRGSSRRTRVTGYWFLELPLDLATQD